MLERARQLMDWESARVWCAAIGVTSLTLAEVNAFLTTIVLIGTIVYTWRKALRPRVSNGICAACLNGLPPLHCRFGPKQRPIGCPRNEGPL